MSRRIAVVGDVLLDRDVDGHAERLCPDAPAPVIEQPVTRDRAGGAGLAATLLAGDGHAVTLITALAPDAGGLTLRALLAAQGVHVVDLGDGGATSEKVRIRADGQVLARVDRGDTPPRVRAPGEEARHALAEADAVLVSDYGRGMTASPEVRAALGDAGPLVWDPHPRGAGPVPGSALLTPNLDEAVGMTGVEDPAGAARRLVADHGAWAVVVTVGAVGAVLVEDGAAPVHVPVTPASGDPCGAGDRFASAAAAAMAAGHGPAEAVRRAAGAASRFVAAGGAGRRPDGVRTVATGGCFDLLHAGHVATLHAARALGDRLVVLLNSDASVRRLKGPGRPVMRQDERAAMLRALRCVDEVVVFDDDTPEAVLARLAPDVWVKGGDYAADDLPEAAVVRALGGEVATVPYDAGRSTTRLIQEVVARAGR
ncbi:MAG TPA: PfkB family carbohydrate kinase [Miltoncostaea sp.]|nr:PfkB family carbohydrate kinase [Miltoncostaea sp.]